jgi:hypothetical protein
MIKDRDIKETKFEEDLKVYFPDIYKIHVAGKFDKYVWNVFSAMMEMTNSNGYGEIKVVYQNGKINRVATTIITTSDGNKPLLTHPGVI